jgi:crotonobetainyl-CoA:carnitine CoA-transferase CaiB-like acyl-CoA transferase
VPADPAPKLAQDTDALLQELRYDPAAIAALRAGRDLTRASAAQTSSITRE